MTDERIETIPLKAMLALHEFNDPASFCAALALDGIYDGRFTYAMWRHLCQEGINGPGTMRLITRLIMPALSIESVGFCRGDQIIDQDIFVSEVMQQVKKPQSKLLIGYQTKKEGHAQSLVTSQSGKTIEYNALLPQFIQQANEERISELLRMTLQEKPLYFYAFGFKLNPTGNNLNSEEYLLT